MSDMMSQCEITADEYPPIRCAEEHDPVNHPSHYTQGGIDCIDAIAAATTGLQGIEAVDTAQGIKYLWRWKGKNGAQCLAKAMWYIIHLLAHLIVKNEADTGVLLKAREHIDAEITRVRKARSA